MSATVVCALYKFVALPDYQEIRPKLLELLEQLEIKGTLLLASEGINGTVSGSRESIDAMLEWLQRDERLAGIEYKESFYQHKPFRHTRVKLKREIVTMGVEGIDPNQVVGTYVEPSDWNALISDPDVVLIDTRNDYEVEVGTFKNAIDPKIDNFRQFPDYIAENYSPEKHKKVAMFCTGGIRCEKSTALLKEQGFEEVYHLKGGILKYLEEVEQQDSLWEGECYVFDDRVTVDHNLEGGSYQMCNACRLPITEEQRNSEAYEEGVSCPRCIDTTSDEQKARFRMRQRQVQLAQQRGENHIGSDAHKDALDRRAQKVAYKEAQRSECSSADNG